MCRVVHLTFSRCERRSGRSGIECYRSHRLTHVRERRVAESPSHQSVVVDILPACVSRRIQLEVAVAVALEVVADVLLNVPQQSRV